MNILKGKSDDEIFYEFLSRKGVTADEWKSLKTAMHTAQREHIIRMWFWKIPMIVIGLGLVITLIISAANGYFPRVFTPVHMTFFKQFSNVMLGIILFLCGIFCIIFPFTVEPDIKYTEYYL
jgi:hypothetical protein